MRSSKAWALSSLSATIELDGAQCRGLAVTGFSFEAVRSLRYGDTSFIGRLSEGRSAS